MFEDFDLDELNHNLGFAWVWFRKLHNIQKPFLVLLCKFSPFQKKHETIPLYLIFHFSTT